MKFVQILLFFSLLVTQTLSAATGDSYSSAKVISVNSTTDAKLKYAWQSGRYYEFKVTVPSSGTVHVYTTNLNYDTDIDVYKNNNFSQSYASDYQYNYNVDVTFTANANDTFNLEIYNFINYKDEFKLYVVFTPDSSYIDNSNDICYEPIQSSGLMCIDLGICSGGVGCSNTMPLRNVGDATLSNVQVYRDETSIGGSFASGATVSPSGTCVQESSIDFGPFGFFGSATKCSVTNDIPVDDNSNEIITSELFSGDCFAKENLYVTYTKNGQNYRGQLNACSTSNESLGGRPFSLRHQENLFGDVEVLGNTVLCILQNDGTCKEPTNTNSNAETNLQKAPQSYSTLTLPQNAVVKYARLYWQGRWYKNSSWNDSRKASASQIQFRSNNDATWETITADTLDLAYDGSRPTYSATADVTNYVQAQGAQKYYVDTTNFYTITGKTNSFPSNIRDGLGAFGAWVLVVVYEDPDSTTAKNITVFDGYQIIDGSNAVEIPVSGFLTPKSGTVDSKVYIFTAEGDKYLTGDDLLMKGLTNNTSYTSIAPNSNNAFNSRVDVTPVRSPNLSNNNGIDIHEYNVGTTSGGENIISTNEVGAKFKFTTGGDVYFPSLVVFSTQLYLPQMCYDYSVKQDGHYLMLDRSSDTKAHIDGYISSSDLEVTVYLKNKEADIPAEGIALKSDVNDTFFDHTGHIFTSNINGSILIDRGVPALTTPLCAYDKNGDNSVTNSGCTNGHDIRKGNGSLGSSEYVYTKFFLSPKTVSGVADINQSLGLSVKYYITVNGNKIEYPDYVLGSNNVPLCPPTGGYTPAFGSFNVVQQGLQTNNLNTQISRKSFTADVIFDSSPTSGTNDAPTTDVNTTVLVEMIDIDAFGDINASCANPDSAITPEPIFVQIQFTPANYQTTIPMQNPDYYDFAVRNGAYRVWYFTDDNDALIENWTATTSDNGKTLSGISGLYDSNVHTACNVACANDTSVACFECIRANYAKPLCSRDNFSVRPESFDIRIYDVNNTLPAYDIATDPTNPKNTTKIDLSALYRFSSDFSTPLVNYIDLAALYNYRFDINATGHNSLKAVPGYTRYFNGDANYKMTLYWEPETSKSNCNDTTNKEMQFYLANGRVLNEERNHDNVGEYRLNITDKSWTAVDWESSYLAHHTTSNGFTGDDTVDDCVYGSSSSSLVGSKHGCFISTQHGSDGNGHTYKDTNLSFHPFEFDIATTLQVGENNTSATASTKPFVYMSDINTSEDMALHVNTTIKAVGKDSTTALSNYVAGCFAEPVDITIIKSDTNNTNLAMEYHTHNQDINGTVITAQDINKTIIAGNISENPSFTAQGSFFQKNLSGAINLRTNINYARDKNKAVNPEEVRFFTLQAKNNTSTFNANLTNVQKAEGINDLNQTVYFYYGRANTGKKRYAVSYDNESKQATLYYEIYCFGVTDANQCKTDRLPSTKRTNDIRWYQNTNHSTTNDGKIFDVSQKGGSAVSASAPVDADPVTTVNLSYNGSRGYPYTTTMEINASNWLIYHPNDPSVTKNEFQVEFSKTGTNWAGEHETNTTTKDVGTTQTSRRVMW